MTVGSTNVHKYNKKCEIVSKLYNTKGRFRNREFIRTNPVYTKLYRKVYLKYMLSKN